MQWQDETTLQDVKSRNENRPDTGFLSWSNYIKQYRDDPAMRFEAAQEFLPWPLGFKESILALRAIIRDKKKDNVDFEPELQALYKLAAWDSFCPKQSQRTGETGFKVFDTIPGGNVASLEIDYDKLGYKELKLLNKTDAKLLVQYYGEPQQHTTLNHLYLDKWQKAEDRYLEQQYAQAPDDSKEESNVHVSASVEVNDIDATAHHRFNANSHDGDEEVQISESQFVTDRQANSVESELGQESGSGSGSGLSSASTPAPGQPAKVLSYDSKRQRSDDSQSANKQYLVMAVSQKRAKAQQVAGFVKQLLQDKVLSKAARGIKRLSYKKKLWAILSVGCLMVAKRVGARKRVGVR